MRRPLAFVCLVYLAIVFALIHIRGIPDKPLPAENYIKIQGWVADKDETNQVIYLSDVTFCNEADFTTKEEYGAICYLAEEGTLPRLGSYVEIEGKVGSFSRATNQGEFDLYAYYFIKGYNFSLKNARINAVSSSYNSYLEGLRSIRNGLASTIEVLFNEEDAGIIKTMMLGDKSSIDKDIKALYQESGISHILSISGLHISIIGMCLYSLLKRMGILVWIRTSIAVFVMVNFGLMTGMGTSTLRAIIMFGLVMLSFELRRSYDIITALCLAGAVIVFQNNYIVLYAGFWLSFLAVFGIAVFSRCLYISKDKIDKVPFGYVEVISSKGIIAKIFCLGRKTVSITLGQMVVGLGNCFMACFSVSFFTLPVVLYYYYEFPLYSIILNIIIVPLMSFLLGIAIVVCLLCELICALAAIAAGGQVAIASGGHAAKGAGVTVVIFKILSYPCHVILWFYKHICKFINGFPLSSIILGKPSAWKIVVFYSICGFILLIHCWNIGKRIEESKTGAKLNNKDELNNKAVSGMNVKIRHKLSTKFKNLLLSNQFKVKLVLICLALILLIPIRRGFKISLIDVGQGDGLCIEYNSKTYMIDGGSSSKNNLAKYQLLPFLKSKGIGHIDYWFISHPDSDHISGLKEMLSEDGKMDISIGTVVLPASATIESDAEELIGLIKARKINIAYVSQGDSFTYKDLSLECINPVKGKVYEDVNAYSEVFILRYKDFSMVLTGDATTESEEDIMEYLGDVGLRLAPTGDYINAKGGAESCFKDNIDQWIGADSKADYKIDILKVGHHGSKTSTSKAFAETLSPDIAVISVGKNNKYGHPNKETIDTLTDIHATIFQTSDLGCIEISVDKTGDYTIRQSRSAP